MVAREYPQLLPAFIARFSDLGVSVRVAAVEQGVRLARQKPALAPELLKARDHTALIAP